MELKLTTKRVLAYEAETGNDIVSKMQEIGETGTVKFKDVIDLFSAMGEGYDVDKFDAWEGSFIEKATAVFNEVKRFINGEEKN